MKTQRGWLIMKNTIDLDDRLLAFRRRAEDWDGSRSTLFIEAEELLAAVALETLLLLIKSGRIIGCDERWHHGALGDMRAMIREEFNSKGRVVEDGLLGVKEAASFINQSTTYVYRNWKEMGGRKIGKKIQFTKAALRKWFESSPKAVDR